MAYVRWLVGQQSRSRLRNRNHPGAAGLGGGTGVVIDLISVGGLLGGEALIAPQDDPEGGLIPTEQQLVAA